MAYYGVDLHNSITLGRIFSIHYFEYMSDFSFEGESHNFWEFVCVDKGEVDVTRGKTHTILKKGDLVFHKPNEFHNVKATGNIACTFSMTESYGSMRQSVICLPTL